MFLNSSLIQCDSHFGLFIYLQIISLGFGLFLDQTLEDVTVASENHKLEMFFSISDIVRVLH